MSIRSESQRGFIALTSVIIMSAILVALMVTTSAGSLYGRFDVLSVQNKRISLGLSEACTHVALLAIARNYSYEPAPGGVSIPVGTDTCTIFSVTYGIEDPLTHRKSATIISRAHYPLLNGSWSATKIIVSVQNPATTIPASSLVIGSWDQLIMAP